MSPSGISGDKSEAARGEADYWVVKLNASGDKEWDRTLGGDGQDYFHDVIQTRDGGFMLAGQSLSGISGDKTTAVRGESDYWIVKLSENGTKVWDKSYGGDASDALYSILEVEDGSYILGGFSWSGISGDKTEASKGADDYWVVKISATGEKIWDKSYGGNSSDRLIKIIKTQDGGFLLGGYSWSGMSGDKTGESRGAIDYWVVKVSADGSKIWDQTIGGNNWDVLEDVIQTADGGYLVGGTSLSGISGDKSEPSRGSNDFWIVKLKAEYVPLPSTCNTIDFESSSPGFVTSVNTGAGVVYISNKKRELDGTYAPQNHAAIFNTASPTRDDLDLWTPDWGNVLIINQDLNSEPNDNPWGGEMTLDFSAVGPVTMTSMKALDFDVYEGNSWVYLYDGAGNELHKVKIENLGNMSQQVVNLGNTKGVMKMKVVLDGINEHGMLAGSGAIDDIKFCVEEVEANEPPQVSAGADQILTCAVAEVTLEGSSSTSGVVYSWTGPEGFTSALATPTVQMAGNYTLTVTDPATGLTASDNVVVTLNNKAPFVKISASPDFDDYISCDNPTVYLLGYTTTVNPIYKWTGPNGFTSNVDVAAVKVPGTYTLTVTDPATGCQASTSRIVNAYFTDISINAGPDKVLTCKEPTVTLTPTSIEVDEYFWHSPDGGNILPRSVSSVVVDKPGTYVVLGRKRYTSCTVTDTVVVTLDMVAPNITAQGGTLSSETGTVQLMGSSTTDGVAYSWAGPEGYTSSEQNPVVSVAGEYTLTVTDVENGCTATATVIVEAQATTGTSAISQATVFPNPIESKGAVEFKLKTTGKYVVELYDLKGNLIRELKAGNATAGELVTVELDGSGLKGGLYIARIMSANEYKTIKVILKK